MRDRNVRPGEMERLRQMAEAAERTGPGSP